MTARYPLLPALATGALVVLGGGCLAAAALLPQTTDAAAPAPSAQPTTTAPGPTAAPETVGASSISDLPDPPWLARTSDQTDIPQHILAAYAGAALSVEQSEPSCGLGWNTLAAIGLVESEHGTLGGAAIGTDGVARPGIVGVPLDGGEVEEVPDSDGGRLDGDTVWDRAVGPMQFIPSTWEHYSVDGNGDGEADVHQIDDAALAAAHYLCDSADDLRDPSGWIAAVAAYNSSSDYNNRVAETAEAYAAAG